MKIRRSDAVYITTTEHKRTDIPKGEIEYDKWVKFIESHKEYFIWYEDTEDGIYIKNNLDKIPDWVREKTIYTLNKKSVYIRKKIEKKKLSPCLDYWNGSIRICLEHKMTKDFAAILIEMANFVGGKLLINGKHVINSIEQVE